MQKKQGMLDRKNPILKLTTSVLVVEAGGIAGIAFDTFVFPEFGISPHDIWAKIVSAVVGGFVFLFIASLLRVVAGPGKY